MQCAPHRRPLHCYRVLACHAVHSRASLAAAHTPGHPLPPVARSPEHRETQYPAHPRAQLPPRASGLRQSPLPGNGLFKRGLRKARLPIVRGFHGIDHGVMLCIGAPVARLSSVALVPITHNSPRGIASRSFKRRIGRGRHQPPGRRDRCAVHPTPDSVRRRAH